MTKITCEICGKEISEGKSFTCKQTYYDIDDEIIDETKSIICKECKLNTQKIYPNVDQGDIAS